MKKYKGRDASIENVKRLFSSTSGDTVSIAEVFQSWPRDPENEKRNRAWLSNLLSLMKFHNLVKPYYITKNGPKTLDKLELTLEGKEVLGRSEESSGSNGIVSQTTGGNSKISIEDILKAVPKLRKENPEFDIEFSVKPKEDSAVAP